MLAREACARKTVLRPEDTLRGPVGYGVLSHTQGCLVGCVRPPFCHPSSPIPPSFPHLHSNFISYTLSMTLSLALSLFFTIILIMPSVFLTCGCGIDTECLMVLDYGQ